MLSFSSNSEGMIETLKEGFDIFNKEKMFAKEL